MYPFIRKRLILLAALSAMLSAAPANTTPTVTLPAGTQVPVRLAQSLDTKRDKPGARFLAHVAAPVTRDGQVILARNASCHGHLAAETRLNFSLRRPLTVHVPVEAAQNRAGGRG